MKKHFTKILYLFGLIICSNLSFGQVLKTIQPIQINTSTTQVKSPNLSPDLRHEHDGEHCLTDILTQEWLENAGIVDSYNTSAVSQNQNAVESRNNDDRATYTLPIIFHVIHNPSNPSENVSEAAINNLLNQVNLDFAAANADIGNLRSGFGWVGSNTDIEFCLAQQDPFGNQLTELGIHRVSTTENFYDPNTESNKMKGSTGGNTGTESWNRNDYINVWICNITNGASSGVAGYAYRPTTTALPPADIDGIVIDYNLGMPPLSRVLTHEIGHYLGLSHTWGSSNTASGCTDDDGLTDTPNTAGPSFDYGGSCSGSQQTCSGIETQYENYMDYANCTVIFTQHQSNLMVDVLNGSRSSLLSSNGCTPINPQPPVADFAADIFSVVQGGSINFTDLSTNYPTGWTWSTSPSTGVTFIGGSTTNSQNVVMQFANTGVYQVSLNASNAYGNDDEIKSAYINVVASGGGTLACDTLRNYTSAEETNMATYTLGAGTVGNYPGTLFVTDITGNGNPYQLLNIADSFFTNTPSEVRRIRLPVFDADDMGGSNNIIFTVWGANGSGNGPGAVLGTESVAISTINAGFWNEIDFSTPVPVSGEFWVGATFEYSTSTYQDTIRFATTNFADRASGPSSTWMEGYEPNLAVSFGWGAATDFFGSAPDCSLILDVLLSTGSVPNAVASWPDNVTCEGESVTMNGFSSTNTDSYYWDISDGTSDFFFDEGNLTTNFNQGTWTISLIADGSCQSDSDGPFTLTVNPPMTGNVSVNDENCTAADGTINVTVSGGDGGAYTYSINSGASTQASGNYTGLIAGDYNYEISDNSNCELTGIFTVGNINNFNPTISPDITINGGTSTTLSVTGGVTWTWYEGTTQIGTTQTVNVSPATTTTYYCNVVDGAGCEASLEVVVSVSTVGVNENLVSMFKLYPNPSNGNFQIIFGFEDAKDVNVEIVNLIGEKVFLKKFNTLSNETLDFDLTHIANGVYFVNIESNGESVTKKIVIRK